MIDFKNAVLGFVLTFGGIILIIHNLDKKKKVKKDVYGNNIGMYTGLIGLIMAGMFLLLRELIKL